MSSEAPGAALFLGVNMTTARWAQKALLLPRGLDCAEEGGCPTDWEGAGRAAPAEPWPWVPGTLSTCLWADGVGQLWEVMHGAPSGAKAMPSGLSRAGLRPGEAWGPGPAGLGASHLLCPSGPRPPASERSLPGHSICASSGVCPNPDHRHPWLTPRSLETLSGPVSPGRGWGLQGTEVRLGAREPGRGGGRGVSGIRRELDVTPARLRRRSGRGLGGGPGGGHLRPGS